MDDLVHASHEALKDSEDLIAFCLGGIDIGHGGPLARPVGSRSPPCNLVALLDGESSMESGISVVRLGRTRRECRPSNPR